MVILTLMLSSQEASRPSAPRPEVFMNHVPNAVCTHSACPVVSVKVIWLLRIPRIECITTKWQQGQEPSSRYFWLWHQKWCGDVWLPYGLPRTFPHSPQSTQHHPHQCFLACQPTTCPIPVFLSLKFPIWLFTTLCFLKLCSPPPLFFYSKVCFPNYSFLPGTAFLLLPRFPSPSQA